MKKKYFAWALLAALSAGNAAVMTSCSEEDTPVQTNPGNQGPTDSDTPDTRKKTYVIAAESDNVSYLVTSESLDEGSVTVIGNGVPVISAAYYVFKDYDYLFALVYNNGGDGTGASYYLNAQGKPTEKYAYVYNRITTYGLWGDNLITASTGDSNETDSEGNIAQCLLFNYLSGKDGRQDEDAVNAENYLGNGEKVTIAGIVEANDKVYTSVIPMGMSKYGINKWPEKVSDKELIAKEDGGQSSGSYEAGEIPRTQYPDSAFVAIYTGNSFNSTPVIARTGKIGFACGRMRSQYYQTIWADDNGNVYVFSPGYGRTQKSTADLKTVEGKLPSGVVRIKAGETDFDPNYYVNLEEIGTKHPVYRCWHITEDYFLLQLYKGGVESMINDGTKADVSELAIFKGEEGTITPVKEMPSDMTVGGEPYGENGMAYVPVNVKSGASPAFYKIDVKTGQATKGLTVVANGISAAGKLAIQQ